MSTTETETTRASAAEIRDGLTHPIIDSDAHWLEFGPLVQERMYEIGGEKRWQDSQVLKRSCQFKKWGLRAEHTWATDIPGFGCCR